MTLKLFNWILSILITIISYIISLLIQVIPNASQPNLSDATTILNQFWEHLFEYFGWICDALCIDEMALNLIIDIMVLRFIAKPTITIIKIAINWIWGAKDK